MSTLSWDAINELLAGVERPARYTGGEINVVHKPESVRARMALCFPDLYEIAESYLGFKILYNIVNSHTSFAAERVYAVAPDLEQRLRDKHTPLWSLDERRPLREFDLVGFTLQYELSYPTILAMLDLGGVPLRAAERSQSEAYVIGGGVGALNPEPVAPFFDAFLLGDGEEAVLEILQVVAHSREHQLTRAATLVALAKISGVYVPSHFNILYQGLTAREISHLGEKPEAQTRASLPCTPAPDAVPRSLHGTPRITRRALSALTTATYPVRQLQPNVQPVHDRFALEIQRGCSQGCRFCQAGMTQRPTRQRHPDAVLAIAEQALSATGVDTLGLLSLSAGDYGPIEGLLAALLTRCEPQRVSLSLPSLRTETLTPEVASRLAAASGSGFTVAPEAGSERLRRVINKTNTDADLLAAVQAAVGAGARSIKLYFMLGLPSETDDDLDAIAALAGRARAAARALKRSAQVTVAVSTFVPKPHTPFQWERQLTVGETQSKQQRLRDLLRPSRIALRYHDAEQSYVEGVLARGDRRLADALEIAMRQGGRLDGWSEHFSAKRWREAFAAALSPHGLTADDYLGERDESAWLPWDHLDCGLLKKFLRRERARSRAELRVEDCARSGRCYACGACDRANPYLPRQSTATAMAPSGVTSATASKASPLVPCVYAPESLPVLLAPASETSPVPPVALRQRLRCRYEKAGAAVHLSQLETVSHILRGVRHARLPVVYSMGYTQRPRLSFSPACPTGIESEAEYFDALCLAPVDPAAWQQQLNLHLPEGLRVLTSDFLAEKARSLSEQIVAMRYQVSLPALGVAQLQHAAESFLAQENCLVSVMRKGTPRAYDVRAVVRELVHHDNTYELTMAFSPMGSVKLSEALAAIVGAEATLGYRARKLALVFSAP